jgi:hypothetical protein
MQTTSEEARRIFGKVGGPIPCTRVLASASSFLYSYGQNAVLSIIAINDVTGKYVVANVYGLKHNGIKWTGGRLGRNYDPKYYTHDLSDLQIRHGYLPANVDDFRVLSRINM